MMTTAATIDIKIIVEIGKKNQNLARNIPLKEGTFFKPKSRKYETSKLAERDETETVCFF